jgi:hypothetical protein
MKAEGNHTADHTKVADRAQGAAQQVRTVVKRAATGYIDFNEQVATRLFDAGEKIAERVEETPLYPLIEFQQTFARKAFEYWVKGARIVVDRI